MPNTTFLSLHTAPLSEKGLMKLSSCLPDSSLPSGHSQCVCWVDASEKKHPSQFAWLFSYYLLIYWKNGKSILGYLFFTHSILTRHLQKHIDTHRHAYTHKHRDTFAIRNEHSLRTCHVVDTLHLWTAFIFNTIFHDRETSREVRWTSLVILWQGMLQGFESRESGFRG